VSTGVRTILVLEAQVPFVRGGAELLVRQLVAQLRLRGYDAERVSVPFKWYPKEEIMAHAAAWRLLDFSESNGRPIDLVIPTKFPTYFARHPRKVCWLVHQHRAAYELCGTPYADFGHEEADVGLRDRLMALDARMLGECVGLYTISRTVSARLETYNGLASTPLYHPPRLADRLEAGPYGSYVLSVARLEQNKRVDLAVAAMAHLPSHLRLAVVGEGTQRRALETIADRAGVSERIDWLGAVPADQLIRLYRDALVLVYVPYDEDYGLATLEAFLARRPVITATDSGGTLEFVEDDLTGYVIEPEPAAIAQAVATLDSDRGRAAALGDAGYEVARRISWDDTISHLVGQG
jgi:glycosyltransferase involved in cell wall biosynthesis